jgi:hypothetical protein
MIWDFDLQITPKLALPNLWGAKSVAIQIEAPTVPDWRKMGFLLIELPIDGDFYTVDEIPIYYGRSIVQIPYLSYRLSFTPVGQLLLLHPQTRFRIAPYNLSNHLEQFIMSASFVAPDRPVGPDSEAIVVATVASSTIATANANRAGGGFIVNNSNRNMWVRFANSAATAAKPSTLVPAGGGNIDIPEDYTGVITAIWAAGATGDCTVHEFSYV